MKTVNKKCIIFVVSSMIMLMICESVLCDPKASIHLVVVTPSLVCFHPSISIRTSVSIWHLLSDMTHQCNRRRLLYKTRAIHSCHFLLYSEFGIMPIAFEKWNHGFWASKKELIMQEFVPACACDQPFRKQTYIIIIILFNLCVYRNIFLAHARIRKLRVIRYSKIPIR